MSKNVLAFVSAILLLHSASPSWADENYRDGNHRDGYYQDGNHRDGYYQDGYHRLFVDGAYRAQLDLNPLGVPRIEALGIVLHADGAVSYNSEHESFDLESAGIGIWKRLRGGRISMGVLGFRVGDASGCALLFGLVPPNNCILKLGATMDREKGGRLVGNVVLTFERLDGVQFSLPPLPITMERLSLEDFPGALPSH